MATILKTLHKTVAAAGTPEPLSATAIIARAVTIQAKHGNTGKVWIGENGLTKASFAEVMHILAIPTVNTIPSFPIGHPVGTGGINLAEIFLDVDVSGEGVVVGYIV